MPAERRNPLDGTTQLLIDGTNVLHAIRRAPQPIAPAALIGRLRGVVPPGVSIVLVLDGAPEPGMVSRRVASGVEVRHASHEPADELILRLVQAHPPAADDLLVVTDDAELAMAVRRSGARTASNRWLVGRLAQQRLSSPSAGAPRPPRPSSRDAGDGDETGRGWGPGRGATRKRGNPRRQPKRTQE